MGAEERKPSPRWYVLLTRKFSGPTLRHVRWEPLIHGDRYSPQPRLELAFRMFVFDRVTREVTIHPHVAPLSQDRWERTGRNTREVKDTVVKFELTK